MLESVVENASREGKLSILNAKGDETLTWDRTNEVKVAEARDKFLDLQKLGYSGFELATTESGEEKPGVQIREFNPEAERIVMIPQMAGG